MLKVIFSLVALIAAGLFTLVFPGSNVENVVVPIIGSIAGAYGIINFRTEYELMKSWFKSKTIVGSLLVAVPILLLVILSLVGIILPPTVVYILVALILGGGGTTIWGIFETSTTNKKVVK